MSAKEQTTALQNAANALKVVIDNTVGSKGTLGYTTDPQIKERDIIEYDSRMRVFGMEKFNAPCFISYVNFFASSNHQANHQPLGAMIIYIEESNVERFLKAAGHSIKLDEEKDIVFKVCGEFCKNIAENFKTSIRSLGYNELIISDPVSYHNQISEGVPFNYDEYKMYELIFSIWKQKILAIDLTLAPPK